jgi:hypothetical protein
LFLTCGVKDIALKKSATLSTKDVSTYDECEMDLGQP